MKTEPIPFCSTPMGFHAVSPDGYCTTCGKTFPPEPSDHEDQGIREKIEEQREADFYHEVDEFPLDEEEDDGDS